MGQVYVVGYFGASNLGDDLLLVESMKQILKDIPSENVTIVCHTNKYIATYFPNISQSSPSEFLRSNLHYEDKVVFAGGGQFSNFSKPGLTNLWGFRDFLSILGIRFLLWRWLNNVRGFPFLIGVGPARGYGAKLGAKLLSWSLEHGSVRDFKSQQFLSDCIVGVDPVLSTFEVNPSLRVNFDTSSREIGIILRNWTNPEDVKKFARNLVSFLLAEGIDASKIKFITFQENYDQCVYSDGFFDQFDLLVWKPELTTIEDFISRFARFDHIFSMRAHGIFLAARLGINVTPVVIEPKISIAAEQIGLKAKHLNLHSDIEDFKDVTLFDCLPDLKYKAGQNNSVAHRQLENFLRG